MTDLCRAALAYVHGRNPDLTVRQIALLGMIVDEPGQSIKTLAANLGVQKPVITRAVTMMVILDLVVRTQRTDDKRHVSIVPTYLGSGLRHKLKGPF